MTLALSVVRQLAMTQIRMSLAPQPVPGAPQGQGNMMNYPMMQTPSGEMGQQIGAGSYQFPYGDLGEGVGDALTPPFVRGHTPTPQSIVPGRGMNGPYNAMAQPAQNADGEDWCCI